jgi:hypothetical protein
LEFEFPADELAAGRDDHRIGKRRPRRRDLLGRRFRSLAHELEHVLRTRQPAQRLLPQVGE